MRLYVLNEFLTFVLVGCFSASVWASPTTQVSPQQLTPQKKVELTPRPFEKESLQVTPQPTPEPLSMDRILATRIVRDKTWNLSYGLWSGTLMQDEGFIDTQVFGITRTLTDPREFSNEYGVDLTTQGYFGGHWEYKKYCCLGGGYEPFWSLGVGGIYKPWDLLAGFIKIGSYQAQAGVGLEDLFLLQRRLRLELNFAVSSIGTSFLIRLGYAFDDSFLSF